MACGASVSAQPGFSFKELLDSAPQALVRAWVGEDTCALLDLIVGEPTVEQFRAMVHRALTPDDVLADGETSRQLLELLPSQKLDELAARLSLTPQHDLLSSVVQAVRSAEGRRIARGFLGDVVHRAIPKAMPSRLTVQPAYGLFDHQRRAAQQVREVLYAGERRVVLHLPTGVGKTRTAMHLVADHLLEHEPTLVVWLASGQELLEQAAAEFETAWLHLGNRPVDVIRLWSAASLDLTVVQDGLIVLGLAKATSLAKSDPRFLDKLASKTTLTVFDEAHQAIAPTYQRAVDALTLRRDAGVLGLTATPGRTWADISADERLAEFFAFQKVSLAIDGYANPVTALIDQGFLARPRFSTVAATSGTQLTDSDRRSLARDFDLPERILARLAHDVQWNLLILRTVLDLTISHQRILVFAASVEHCRIISAVLSGLDIESDYITGETEALRRGRIIDRFKSGADQPIVLCNYGVLTTGFDAPRADATVIARPTRSLVLYSQMIGRVIRGPRAGGTSTCDVVTVVNPELPGFGDVAEAFSNWEDVWAQK